MSTYQVAAIARAYHDVPRVPPGEADLAAWRSALGNEAFEEAQAWGRSAGTKRAVEFALQQA